MNHVTARLQAYHDGELQPRTAEIVEAHLTKCEACLGELETLETLSSLLHEIPPAAPLISEDRFAAQVMLCLPTVKATVLPERALKWGWRLAPAMLIATWMFVQAVTVLTTGIGALLRFGIGNRQLELLIPEQPAEGALAIGAFGSLLEALGIDAATGSLDYLAAVGWNTFVPLLFTGLTALAVGSWVAMWLATQHKAGGRRGLRETS